MNRRVLLIAVLLTLLLGGCGAIILAGEFVPYEDDIGFQGEARRDEFLAAERLLTRMGVPARGASRLRDLPPVGHVLFLRAFGHGLGINRAQEVRDWLHAGGRLVLLYPDPPDLALFDALADEPVEPRPPESSFLEQLGLFVTAPWDAEDDELVTARVAGPGFEVAYRTVWRIGVGDLPTSRTDGPEDEYTAVRAKVGEGELLALCTASWMENDAIDEHEHAALLWALASARGVPEGALLVRGERMPGLFAALLEHAPLLCGAGVFWIALWLWSRSGRFGPRLPDPGRDRRDFADHVAAAGAFMWRHGAANELLEPARRAALEPWLRRLPGAARDDEVPVEAIAEETGVPQTRVREAFAGDPGRDPHRFTRAVRDLARIRRTR